MATNRLESFLDAAEATNDRFSTVADVVKICLREKSRKST